MLVTAEARKTCFFPCSTVFSRPSLTISQLTQSRPFPVCNGCSPLSDHTLKYIRDHTLQYIQEQHFRISTLLVSLDLNIFWKVWATAFRFRFPECISFVNLLLYQEHITRKHRKNCECCPVSQLIDRYQRLSRIQVLNCQNCNQCLKCHKFPGLSFQNCQKLSQLSQLSKIDKNVQNC